jgi:tetratricopeptide (TPR) repeat protein
MLLPHKFFTLIVFHKMKNFKIIPFLCLIVALFACQNAKETPKTEFAKTGNRSIDSLTDLIFKDANKADLYFKRAQLFNENGAVGGFDFAIKDMEYALTLDSTNVGYHLFLSDVYLDAKQSRLAVATMERAVSLAPDSIPTLLKLTELYLITKQYAFAGNTVEKIMKRDPQNAQGYFMFGMIFKEMGDDAKAINSFQKAADLNADNKDAFIELGQLFTKRNSPLALRYFDNALLLDSLDLNALMGKAYYLQLQKKIPEAVALYRKAVEIDPHYSNALFNLGILYLEQNDLDKAYFHFDLIIKQSVTFYRAYYYRGFIEEKRGNKEAAITDYKQALEFRSDYDKALEGLKRLGAKIQ